MEVIFRLKIRLVFPRPRPVPEFTSLLVLEKGAISRENDTASVAPGHSYSGTGLAAYSNYTAIAFLLLLSTEPSALKWWFLNEAPLGACTRATCEGEML